MILVIEKQKRRLKKVSVGEGIDLFITHMYAEKKKMKRKEKKNNTAKGRKIEKKNELMSPFLMI